LYPRIHNSYVLCIHCLAVGTSIRPSRQHVTILYFNNFHYVSRGTAVSSYKDQENSCIAYTSSLSSMSSTQELTEQATFKAFWLCCDVHSNSYCEFCQLFEFIKITIFLNWFYFRNGSHFNTKPSFKTYFGSISVNSFSYERTELRKMHTKNIIQYAQFLVYR
jgi:hypothetical protein